MRPTPRTIRYNYMSDLHTACRLGDLALITALLAKRPEAVNERDEGTGWAPLYRSVICQQAATVRLLLRLGADPDATYKLGETALHHAAEQGYLDIAKELLKAGANPNIQQKGTHYAEGDTPLHKAASGGYADLVRLLLDAKANPNLSNQTFGRTPLHYAVESRSEAVVKLLVQHGACPFIKDKVHFTQRGKKPSDLTSTAELKQLLFLQTPRRTLSQSSASSSPIFNVTFEEQDSIPPISQLAFEKLTLSPSSSCSDVPTTASRDPKNPEVQKRTHRIKSTAQLSLESIEQSDLPVEPEEERTDTKPKERTFSFGKGGDRRALYTWLAQYSLEGLFDILVDSGYDDVEQMVAQMRTHMPITTDRLRSIGIAKPGHATRLLAALELELKAHPSLRNKSAAQLKCCVSPKATSSLRMYPTLSQWLDELGLGMLYLKFAEAGYEDLEPLLAVMKSSYSITENDLRIDFKIEKPGHRHRIMSKLHEDSLYFDPFLRPYGSLKTGLIASKNREEEESRGASCDFCRTM